ncbi:prenyltransferase/squalene oxidase repeat-containing protein [Streptomyces sp. NBC_00690]|uniref:prenyltransferase/squalene oxidase repeat-containing protein n=1 Tax=Streptomyces sp. NBC_00690 TaxID=2975808 RepID=UPI002E2ACC85|nr:prenyltransferase/squalene oxidase repeat-containing protein [Streptomyces sp. NBC_00690]
MTTVRRSAAALAVTAVIGAAIASAAAPAAFAAPTPTPSAAALPPGLYGKGDPAYDGVWRQSLALLALDTEDVKPATAAVDWLTGQQCDSGAFPSYRADTKADCGAKLPLDSNATAAAVQALTAVGGQDKTVEKSVDWLKSVQNTDGGWSYNPGGASDANSTAVVIGALAAAGEKPADVKSKGGKSPYDALLTFAQPCGGTNGGAFVYQPAMPGLVGDSTAAAVIGAHGKGLAAEPENAKSTDAQGTACKPATTIEGAAHNGGTYLATALAKTGYLTTPPMPGSDDPKEKPDFGNTADAVVALQVQGLSEQAKKSLAWLEADSAGWAKESGPAAYAQLIFAANAADTDPEKFGGKDLVAELTALGPEPQQDEKDEKDDSGIAVWWIVGAFFAASVGVGILFSGRRKNQS